MEYNKIHRCSICNSVNVSDIETDIGDYHEGMSFVEDPSHPLGFICIDCEEEIQELRWMYELQDQEKEELDAQGR